MAKRGVTFYANFFKLIAEQIILDDFAEAKVLFAEMTPENQKNCVRRFLNSEFGIDGRKELGAIGELIDLIS